MPRLLPPQPADENDLMLFHSSAYLECLERNSKRKDADDSDTEREEYGLSKSSTIESCVMGRKPAGIGRKPARMGRKPAGIGRKPAGMERKPAGIGTKHAGMGKITCCEAGMGTRLSPHVNLYSEQIP